MAPYRHSPKQVGPRPEDPEQVRRWIALRDRFGDLDSAALWPPPAERPFEVHALDSVAVSDDGKRILLALAGSAWIIDTQTMVADPLGEVPADLTLAALNDDGSRAVLICGGCLYAWDLSTPGSRPQAVWRAGPLESTYSLRLSADGRIAATAPKSNQATVRIFDLGATELVYSFKADCDEDMRLHPGGRHILCFGDDGHARVYGQGGYHLRVSNTSTGAFSRDGRWLISNDLGEEQTLRFRPLDASRSEVQLGEQHKLKVDFAVDKWGGTLRFSPCGQLVLVSDSDGMAYFIAHTSEETTGPHAPARRGSAILADSRRALLVPARKGPCRLVDCEQSRRLGLIAGAMRDNLPLPVATSPLGIYGVLEAGFRPITDELSPPYERPSELPSLLGGTTAHPIDRKEELLKEEVSRRWEVWQPFLGRMTVDIGRRELMKINLGLVHLTAEIVHRAEQSCGGQLRFGKPQLTLQALRAAGDELRGASRAERERTFEAMLDRHRAG